MIILDKLASALNQRDEAPNIALAKQIVESLDKKAVKELVLNLNHKNKDIQSDCIKVIYEIGVINPQLVASYIPELINLLDTKNNRLQWGAMTAIHSVVLENPKAIYEALSKIIDVANKGSVITNDHCVGILIKLCSLKEFAEEAFSLLNERLLLSPTNQLPMYSENVLSIINNTNKTLFIKTLTSRLGEIEKESKRLRVEKVIKKLMN